MTVAFVAFAFCMIACPGPLPCPDCDTANDDDKGIGNDDAPLPDLPCGGADLETDNLNCGTCGHECPVWYVGTEYEAGTCHAGVCGPGWSSCVGGVPPEDNCAEVCTGFGASCVPNGCSGYTGLLFEVLFGEGCDPSSYTPAATMTGGCDEPIPWMTTGDYPREVSCCCDHQ